MNFFQQPGSGIVIFSDRNPGSVSNLNNYVLFKDADKANKTKENVDGVLDRDEFLQLFRTLTARPDLDTILRLFSSNNQPFLETNDLHKFLTNEQGVSNLIIRKK